jgi:hypothetical protein
MSELVANERGQRTVIQDARDGTDETDRERRPADECLRIEPPACARRQQVSPPVPEGPVFAGIAGARVPPLVSAPMACA